MLIHWTGNCNRVFLPVGISERNSSQKQAWRRLRGWWQKWRAGLGCVWCLEKHIHWTVPAAVLCKTCGAMNWFSFPTCHPTEHATEWTVTERATGMWSVFIIDLKVHRLASTWSILYYSTNRFLLCLWTLSNWYTLKSLAALIRSKSQALDGEEKEAAYNTELPALKYLRCNETLQVDTAWITWRALLSRLGRLITSWSH